MCIPTTDAKHFFERCVSVCLGIFFFLDSSVGLTNTVVILFWWGEERAGMEVSLHSTEQCAVLICDNIERHS